jgi:hypothetical protein
MQDLNVRRGEGMGREMAAIVSREGCATPGHVQCRGDPRRALEQARGTLPQRKIGVTSKTPVGVISVVTLIRTDTTLDHSQKAEKV